ncbi:MAG: protein-L-isoaspartate(D-aspartate) O-methyltransferase [Prolixibacteraceae bacterium]|nr:protein-L-isoaspartate(D-aspartate) O-methyltransferase [Prolixibacteraceae bacterium]
MIRICFPLVVFFLFISLLVCGQIDNDYHSMRYRMVALQMEARGIKDKRVLDAFRKVERHRFVLPEYISYAYNDSPLPIDEGQTISQPYIVAYMTEALNLQEDDKVLEIGTGSGYQAAILAELCDSVFTIEIFEKLGERAKEIFSELGYENIFSKTGDGFQGWPEYAPFDAIIVTCAPSKIPEPLQQQLAEGGRMIIPVGTGFVQHLILLEKKKGKIKRQNVLPVRFVPMLNKKGGKY